MAEETAKGSATTIELSKSEQGSARRVAEAKATIPHLVLELETAAGALADGPVPPRALVVAACARALTEHPRLNATYRDGRVEAHSRVNVAISLAAGEAAVTPTIFDADGKAPAQIEAEIAELGERARSGHLRAAELSGATFTVVDLTGTGVRASAPIVVPGQAAGVTVGDPAADGTARLVFACDARIAPWPVATPFVARVKALLEAEA